MWDDDRGPGSWHGDGWGMHDGGGWAGWLFMTVLLLLLVALLVVAVLALVRAGRPGGGAPGAGAPPADRETGDTGSGADRILAERFARGEIDVDEYRARRAALRSG